MSTETIENRKSKIENLQHRHLLGLADWSAGEIRLVLQTARRFRDVLDRSIPQVPTLQGTTVATLFFEPSTRTKLSFNLAASRLSASTISFSKSGSSVSKGESLKDTAQNIEAMKTDLVVLRHPSPGAPHFLTRHIGAAIISAGDGGHEHPTQALLDLLTIADRFDTFDGLKVSIIGDVAHSRVARSNVFGLQALGAEVTLCGPPTMLPLRPGGLSHDDLPGSVRTTSRLGEALDGCDVAMALRIQLERQTGEPLFPSLREYHARFGLTRAHLAAHPELLIMHPGPVNRGVELESEVVDHERAVILDQVTNGVALRMAVLYLLSGAAEDEG
jgi:aspartate carbamoyltransferase catalytic subunit